MFPNMSDDFVMLAFDQEQTIPNNLCAEKLFDHSLPINNNDNGFKEKIQKCSLVPAIIFGATHIPVKKEEEFPEDPDFLANCGYQSAKTPIPENLRLVLQHVSKSAKKEVISQTWPSDDIPYAKQSNHWVSITFLEYSNQIGNVFRGFTTEIFIEGIHANPDPRRMCLSQMINAEKRTASREIVNQIGEGIHLRLLSKAVELSSKCSLPIFLQAPVFSLMYDRNVNVSTVYRLPPSASIKIFDFEFFNSLLSSESKSTWQDTESLQKLASIKLSFGKGFGKDYRRTSIEETPCWLHIVFIDPIRIIDHLLMQAPLDGKTVHSNT